MAPPMETVSVMAQIASPGTTRTATIHRPRVGTMPTALALGRSLSLQQRFMAALLVMYVAKALLFVFIFPPFSGHDEVAHYSTIETVVNDHTMPNLLMVPEEPGQSPYLNRYEYQLPDDLYKYCRYTLQWICLPNNPQWANNPPRMSTNFEPEGVNYAANHPPLYYMIAAPVYWLAKKAGATDVTTGYLLRMLSIPFGVLVVVLAYMTIRLIFPRDPFLTVTVPAFVALQTQVSYEATMINNDIVSIAAYSWVLYLVVRAIREGFRPTTSLLIGFAVGIGVISKTTSITAIGVVGLAMLTMLSIRSAAALRDSLPEFIRTGIIIAVPTALMAVPWYLHMYLTYGNFSALPQVLQLQSTWNKPAGTFTGLLFNLNFVKDRLNETWGEYGWRVLPFSPSLMHIIAIALLIPLCGAIAYAVGWRPAIRPGDDFARPARWQLLALGLLIAACVISYLATIQFGTQFALTQARYFFPVINALAILTMIGYRAIIPVRWLAVGRGVIVAALLALNIFAMTSYVIPYYWL